ncbi:MAG: nucleotidyltransferase domain-containing protein, partial [Chloroflexota bacterium]
PFSMPTRSLNSSVFKWPNARAVESALRHWAERIGAQHPDVLRVGYFGSYARGDWSVGSDLDVLIIVESSTQPFEQRAVPWDTISLPVQTDVLMYTQAEWDALDRQGRFYQTLMREAVWVYIKRDERVGA